MNWGEGREKVEDVVVIGGLIGMQVIYAGNSVLLSFLMSLGVYPLSIIIFCTFASFLVLSPFAFVYERTHWPKNFKLKLFIQVLVIASCGVTLFQALFLKGIEMTSPALATAMPNLVPGLVFVIAWIFRLEQVNLSCTYSKVKVLGTLICVVGAVTMSILHGINTEGSEGPASPTSNWFDQEKIIGGLCLMGGVFALSSSVVLQADTLREFPAPMTLCAVTSLIGSLLTALVQLVQDHHLTVSWPKVSFFQLIGFSLLAGTFGGICVSFNGWAMKKRGPVLASIFNPIATVVSIILSAITLNESVNLGSLAGMCVMFVGLYFVLWAKSKERSFEVARKGGQAWGNENGAKKPLLA